jgi:dTDP-4-amino-4,6-dideoxygalactose transaminase
VALDRQHEAIADDLHAALDSVLQSGGFILGAEVDAFEAEFAAYCGARHCVGVASGTAALMLALLAAGIGKGDEVIVPAHTFIATALAVVHAGATPIFCEVDEATGLIDPDAAAAAVTTRTAAIAPVHLYGQPCDMDAINALASQNGLIVLEDAAQAHGASWRGRRPGQLGTVAGFSFYPSKNLGALGDGGAIVTNDAEIAERARRLRHLGQRRKGQHVTVGFNERLDGLQAAFLRLKLRSLDEGNEARRRVAERYDRDLPTAMRVLPQRDEASCVYHLYPVRLEDRDRAAAFLGERGVLTGIHYDRTASDHAAWRELGLRPQSFPVAEGWARTGLSLPMFPELELHEQEHVIDVCHEYAHTLQSSR